MRREEAKTCFGGTETNSTLLQQQQEKNKGLQCKVLQALNAKKTAELFAFGVVFNLRIDKN
jgi:hypothetical protein